MSENTCLIVYASMSGNTAEMAEAIAEGIKAAGAAVEIKDILLANTVELEDYQGILLGAYTWDQGSLPDEFIDFYEEMDTLDLTGKLAAAFGSCDSSYEHRGAAVDILMGKLQQLGAQIALDGLKIDLAPNVEEKELCSQFGRQFANMLLAECS
ncbi:flavodoxin [Bacillus rubiinfantis]|uniref:flavodoxin n=1 Tax=Bacillus rubiinfantis TaxID=1499680 RepID=UPI0005AA5659|nr:flavodoxin [Bacillus rubiinfantis]